MLWPCCSHSAILFVCDALCSAFSFMFSFILMCVFVLPHGAVTLRRSLRGFTCQLLYFTGLSVWSLSLWSAVLIRSGFARVEHLSLVSGAESNRLMSEAFRLYSVFALCFTKLPPIRLAAYPDILLSRLLAGRPDGQGGGS